MLVLVALRDLVNDSLVQFSEFLSGSSNIAYKINSPTEIYVKVVSDGKTPSTHLADQKRRAKLSDWVRLDLSVGNSSITSPAVNNANSPLISMLSTARDAASGSEFVMRKSFAVFCVDIVLKEGKLIFSTSPDDYETLLLELFNNAIDSAAGIPQLEQKILSHLVWASSPVLEGVHKMEPQGIVIYNIIMLAVECREKIRTVIRSAAQYLHTYLRVYTEVMLL